MYTKCKKIIIDKLVIPKSSIVKKKGNAPKQRRITSVFEKRRNNGKMLS